MNPKFRVYLFCSKQLHELLSSHLAALKPSPYPSLATLYCRQKLRRNTAPARLKEIAELTKQALTLT
jgi:hypothetical protein